MNLKISNDKDYWRVYILVIAFLLVYLILIYTFLSSFLLHYPYGHDYAEGVYAYSSLLILRGKKLYIDFSYPQPFLFAYIESILLLINKSFLILRFFSFITHIFTALTIFLLIDIFSKDKCMAFIGALFYLSTLTNITWVFIAIPDHLEIFFETFSLYLFYKYIDSKKLFWLFSSSLLLYLAFFTKFFAIVAIIVLSMFLLKVDEKFINKLLYFYIILGLIPLSYITMNFLTHGNFFLYTFFLHLLKPRYNFSLYFLKYFYNNSILVSLTFVLIITCIKIIMRDIKIKFLSVYFLLLFIFTIYGRLTEGAYEHYFLHVEPSMFILIFTLIARVNNIVLRKIVLLLLLVQVVFSAGLLSHYVENLQCAYIFSLKLSKVLTKYNISSDTMTLVEFPGIAFHNNLIIKNNFVDSFCYNLLYKRGYWLDSELIKSIKEDDVKLIIIGSRLKLFENFTRYVSQHYILKEYIYYCDFTGERQMLCVYCKP